MQNAVKALIKDHSDLDALRDARGQHTLSLDMHFDHCEDLTYVNIRLRPTFKIVERTDTTRTPTIQPEYQSTLLQCSTKPRTIMRWRAGEREMTKHILLLVSEILDVLTKSIKINHNGAMLRLIPGYWRCMLIFNWSYVFFFV